MPFALREKSTSIKDVPETSAAALTAPFKTKRRRGFRKALVVSLSELKDNVFATLRELWDDVLVWFPGPLAMVASVVAVYLLLPAGVSTGDMVFLLSVAGLASGFFGLMFADLVWKDWIRKVIRLSEEEVEE